MRVSLCAVFVLAAVAGCSAPASRANLPTGRLPAPQYLRVRVVEGTRAEIRRVPLEEYVQATAISEFAPPSGDLPLVEKMLEVQAIISRTYALAHLGRHGRDGYDLCATTHCQLFQPGRLRTSRWVPAVQQAAAATAAQVLWHSGAPAAALFHADCGGHTSTSSTVWGGAGRSYLVAIEDDGPAAGAHATWQFDAPVQEVRRALNADDRTRIGARLDGITVLDRDDAGRAVRIALHGPRDRIVRGEDLREVLGRAFGARSIKSTWLEVRREGGRLYFEGRGFGHGVGLCQAGALARLKTGDRPSAVLMRYYPGTRLVTLD